MRCLAAPIVLAIAVALGAASAHARSIDPAAATELFKQGAR